MELIPAIFLFFAITIVTAVVFGGWVNALTLCGSSDAVLVRP